MKLYSNLIIVCFALFTSCTEREEVEHLPDYSPQFNEIKELIKTNHERNELQLKSLIKIITDQKNTEDALARERKVSLEKNKVNRCLVALRKLAISTEMGVTVDGFAELIKELKVTVEPLVFEINDPQIRDYIQELKDGFEKSYNQLIINEQEYEKALSKVKEENMYGEYFGLKTKDSMIDAEYAVKESKIEADRKVSVFWAELGSKLTLFENSIRQNNFHSNRNGKFDASDIEIKKKQKVFSDTFDKSPTPNNNQTDSPPLPTTSLPSVPELPQSQEQGFDLDPEEVKKEIARKYRAGEITKAEAVEMMKKLRK